MIKYLNCKGSILLLLLILTGKCYGNINAIDFTKISTPENLSPKIKFLQDNLGLYDHWVHEWKADIKKEVVVKSLSSLYDDLDKQTGKNLETTLLLGDVAHYLYNMELEPYYKKALGNYLKATEIAPGDFRAWWFLGNHYAMSAQSVKGIAAYQSALKINPQITNGYFWFDYAFASTMANMPATSKYAITQSIKILGGNNSVSESMRRNLEKILRQPPADTSLTVNDIWALAGKRDNKIIITNRVVGTRLVIDSTWRIVPNAYQNGATAITFMPTPIINKVNNQSIDYSILVMARKLKEGQTLNDFINPFFKPEYKASPVKLTTKYNDCIAYEITDPEIYESIGGGRIYMMAIARDEPGQPGMLLETADTFPAGNGKIANYRVEQHYSRIKGKLYYLVLLDSCGYIHDESLAVFKDFIENGLLIE